MQVALAWRWERIRLRLREAEGAIFFVAKLGVTGSRDGELNFSRWGVSFTLDDFTLDDEAVLGLVG